MSNATLEREGRSAQDVRHAPNSPTNSFDHQSLDNDPQRSLAHAAQRRLLRTQTERASREYVNEDDLHEHERKRADKLAKERREETEVVKPEMVNLAQHTETEPHRQTQAKLKDYEKMLGAHLAKAGQL